MNKSTVEKFTALVVALTIVGVGMLVIFTTISLLDVVAGIIIGFIVESVLLTAWLLYLGKLEIEKPGDDSE